MDPQISELIKRLREVRMGLRTGAILHFEHEGSDLTTLIQSLKTDQDVIDLAHRILDGLVPGTDYADENRDGCEEDDMEEMIAEREEIETFHLEQTRPRTSDDEMEFSSEENGPEFDSVTIMDEIFDELGLSGYWATINQFLRDVGYPEVAEDFPFDLDIVEEVLTSDLEQTRESYYEFFSGEMDQTSGTYINVMGEIYTQCGDSRKDFTFELDFLDGEKEDEDEDNEKAFRELCSDSLSYLQEEFETSDHLKKFYDIHLEEMDIEAVCDLYDEVESEIEKQDQEAQERREELMHKLTLISMNPDAPEEIQECEGYFGDFNDEELEGFVKDSEDLLKGRKVHKRKRDYFDEQDVLASCGSGDPESALEEIRYEQQNTDLCINPTAFKMLCKEIVQDFIEREEYDFEPGFYEALQVASEDFLIRRFENANLEAIHASRTHIQPKDMQIVIRVEQNQGFSGGSYNL